MDKDIEMLLNMLDEKQMKIINKLDYDKTDFLDLVDKVEDYLQLNCLTDDDGVTEEGLIVLSILDIISDM